MAHREDDESASINRRDSATVLADYTAWLSEQPLSTRTREAYLAAVTAFVAWLDRRDAGPGDALVAPRARDLAARDYKRHMKVERGLSPALVNQALAGMDHLFRFLGLGAAIVRREELPRSAPRALDVEQQRLLLQAAEESTARDRTITTPLRADVRTSPMSSATSSDNRSPVCSNSTTIARSRAVACSAARMRSRC
jgi:integrase/recombinase XerC